MFPWCRKSSGILRPMLMFWYDICALGTSWHKYVEYLLGITAHICDRHFVIRTLRETTLQDEDKSKVKNAFQKLSFKSRFIARFKNYDRAIRTAKNRNIRNPNNQEFTRHTLAILKTDWTLDMQYWKLIGHWKKF